MHLGLQRLQHFHNAPRLSHGECNHLTCFSLNLNVGACGKNGNMQVQ